MTEVAIVTGASRGIGAAIARLLGRSGYSVCVNFQSDEAGAGKVVSDIERSSGRAIAVRADVSDPKQIAEMFDEVDSRLGTLSALVNNAGIHGPRCRFESLSRVDLEAVLDVNVLGLMECTQQAARRMSTRHGGNGGAIVNISSGSAYIGNAGYGVHYAVSKGAVNSFTIGVSQELASEGIRVNAVSPGLTRTDMPPAHLINDPGPAVPIGRVAEPEEIAESVLWLLSPKASYVAGANIRVSGGRP